MTPLILLLTLNLFAQETTDSSYVNHDVMKITEQNLTLYAIRYGVGPYPIKFIDSRTSSGTVDFDWLFWLIEWKDKLVLIDTGFNEQKYVEKFGLIRHNDPVHLIAQLGFEPTQVTDIIITHSHFDHIGNTHRFPRANIWIQEKEFASFTKTNRYKDQSDWYNEASKSNRLHLIDGDKEISPGIFVQHTGGHTVGHQIIILKHTQTHVFVGDECYTNVLCQEKIPLPSSAVFSQKNNQAFLDSLQSMYDTNVQVHLLHDFK